MIEKSIFKKHEVLQDILKSFVKVAVAFSGGVDSSLLLFTAGNILGKENVLALHGVSCLNNQKDTLQAQTFYEQYCSESSHYKLISFYPLTWKEVVVNTENRCYFCKKRMYTIFKEELEKWGGEVLLDGTNKDDLKDSRPGFRAIRELSVRTPLLDAGLNKSEIRILAREFGLSTHNLPSNSCLATRITTHTPLQEKTLSTISEAENFLAKRGFLGTRVRPKGDSVYISVQNTDFERICLSSERIPIFHYFQSLGFQSVLLDLLGR
jgi:pyridinium-3,5-biscarboxylic acid mononucleotide sulfurtransferase